MVFGEDAVLGPLDLEVRAGEHVCLVGPSGAGKTTLLRLLNGTVRAGSGRVLLDGAELAGLSARALRHARTRVGFVLQDHALVPNLRVSQNVAAGRLGSQGFLAALRSMLLPRRAQLAEVHALLARVGIEEKLFQRTDTLSGGQQQRVAVARALYQRPGALVADEPVASVDPERARDLVALFRDVAAENGLTLVMSLHDVELAREFFPRMLGLRGGRLRFDRHPRDIAEEELAALYSLDGGEPGGA